MRRIHISSGTERQLEAARVWLKTLDGDCEILVVASNWGTADDFVRSCCSRPGGRLGLHRMTFVQLATDIATPALAVQNRGPITALWLEAAGKPVGTLWVYLLYNRHHTMRSLRIVVLVNAVMMVDCRLRFIYQAVARLSHCLTPEPILNTAY